MRIPRLSFDIDGVLCDVVGSYLRVINSKHGLSLKEEDWVDYEKVPQLSSKQFSGGWRDLLRTPDLWLTLQPYPDVSFGRLAECMGHGLYNGYFVTRRSELEAGMVTDAQLLTRAWLAKQGLDHATAVLAHKCERGPLLQSLEIDAHIDDWGEQFLTLRSQGINAYLVDRPWNRHIQAGAFRVANVHEFVQQVLSGPGKDKE